MEDNIKYNELTERKLVIAVGEIFKSEGYKGLGVNRVAKQADVSKKLIYRYFGGINYLIETKLHKNKNGTAYDFTSLSHWVTVRPQFSNTFIDDLMKLASINIEL